VKQTVKEPGRLDILVNNAGIFSVGSMDAVSLKDFDEIFGQRAFGLPRIKDSRNLCEKWRSDHFDREQFCGTDCCTRPEPVCR